MIVINIDKARAIAARAADQVKDDTRRQALREFIASAASLEQLTAIADQVKAALAAQD